MKLNYYPETDSLYIDLSEKKSVESKEVADGIIVDFDEKGAVVGFDIDHASKVVNLQKLESDSMPVKSFAIAS
ncbi:MAG: hypothetical protein COZ80_00865 [Ignavibacteria bacterium CG_4_8_14_3_um_filter_37_9]|nr:DUF2283 domain-containing protein [Ignavibacteria bacterium]OIO15934.1 MAG: hypothetical protein AUJ54_11955 [Ignavibacteria bacterium CG1_02_37_35]PIS45787.1 MAG: hypothetical protein COT22_03450 [Ignavibacteria bacterium CG08_land_8_20_14_0_20_37_9]PIX00299.1 MAG: hypothetical protein COZ80_00865 [Ignavibacteria bacterium CG_4_8_14_3_um_filter_37_9]PIX95351.1 MAG: hypothetical protein COZ25_00890 [Ignavibacteria bacterium CG_4_10_14_3_um_filter_37_18]